MPRRFLGLVGGLPGRLLVPGWRRAVLGRGGGAVLRRRGGAVLRRGGGAPGRGVGGRGSVGRVGERFETVEKGGGWNKPPAGGQKGHRTVGVDVPVVDTALRQDVVLWPAGGNSGGEGRGGRSGGVARVDRLLTAKPGFPTGGR